MAFFKLWGFSATRPGPLRGPFFLSGISAHLQFCLGELGKCDLLIDRAVFHQLLMRADARHSALIEDNNAVGIFHRADALGNNQAGGALQISC